MAHIVYYNAELSNVQSFPIAAEVNDTRAQAIIDTPEDYDMSIVRWDLDTSLIPPCYIPMAPSPAPPLQTQACIGMTRGVDVFGPIYVNLTAGLESGFFFSYTAFLSQVNAAIAACYALIAGPSAAVPPVLAFNATTGLISLYYPSTYLTGVPPIQLYVNSVLYRYVLNMPAAIYPGAAPGFEFRIKMEDQSALLLPPTGTRYGYPAIVNAFAGDCLQLTQQEAAMECWTASRTIFITTSSIPVVNENQPTDPSGTRGTNSGLSTAAIITDFSTAQLSPLDSANRISYLPSAEYRRVALRGREPLNRISLRLYWSDYRGNSYPVNLPPGGFFSAKLAFIHRSHKD